MNDQPVRRSLRPSIHFHKEHGAPPGSIKPDPEAPKPLLRVMAYGPEGMVERELQSIDDLHGILGYWPVTWVNVDGLGDATVIQSIGTLFGLHALALEDVVHVHQRPKVEDYPEDLFVVMRLPVSGERLSTEQFSLFLGKDFVVTFQEVPGDCLNPVRDRIRRARGKVRSSGADYLAYALMDAAIDAYFPLVEEFADRIESLEDEAVQGTGEHIPREILGIRHDLLTLRRAVWPLRETLSTLYRDEIEFIQHETRVYLRDCFDHTHQLIEVIESYHEMSGSLMEVYMTSVSNKMNEVMKVLTMIATIFIPLSFIAGIYGMNFSKDESPWNMPELDWYYGYPFSLGLMAVMALGFLIYFRRKGWL